MTDTGFLAEREESQAHASASPITVKAARAIFASLTSRCFYRGERIILTKHGKTVAAMVGPRDLELLLRMENASLADDARKIRSSLKGSDSVRFDPKD
jgi:antitoxin (DNA-binding transcriptional repressor) of toxin-antitoxin stability system